MEDVEEPSRYEGNYGKQGGVFSREKTSCVHNHPYTEENTVWVRRVSKKGEVTKRRACRTCRRHAEQRYHIKRIVKQLEGE